MIFVTVGTQLPFDRLIRGADTWAARHPDTQVFAQTGVLSAQNHAPEHMDHVQTMTPDDFDDRCRNAQVIVAHAGTGSIMTAHATQTPLVIMPRLAQLGEHRNDHQRATAERFGQRAGVYLAWEETDLPNAIDAALENPALGPDLQPSADDSLIAAIRGVIFDTDAAGPR